MLAKSFGLYVIFSVMFDVSSKSSCQGRYRAFYKLTDLHLKLNNNLNIYMLVIERVNG